MTLIIDYWITDAYFNTFIHYCIDSIHATGMLMILYRDDKAIASYNRKRIKSIRIADGTIHDNFGSKR